MVHLPFFQHQSNGDLTLGQLWNFPISPLFRVPASARTAHLYVIGMSGKGKSKFLEHCLYQDIAAGPCCGGGSVIDFWMKWRGCDFIAAMAELAGMLL
jgi:hypothetical protein